MEFYKYTLKKGNVLKDGHTMFLQDVVKDLQRKSFLEEEKLRLEKELDVAYDALNRVYDSGVQLDELENVVRVALKVPALTYQ